MSFPKISTNPPLSLESSELLTSTKIKLFKINCREVFGNCHLMTHGSPYMSAAFLTSFVWMLSQ